MIGGGSVTNKQGLDARIVREKGSGDLIAGLLCPSVHGTLSIRFRDITAPGKHIREPE
jgi:hypothetical protein